MKNRLLMFVLIACSCTVSAADPQESLDERILWSPNEPEHAIFVPQAVLARTPIGALPLADHARRDLAEKVESARKASARPASKERPIADVVDEIAAETIEKVGATTDEHREGIRRMVERSVRRARELEERYRPGCDFHGTAAEGPPKGPVDRLADIADRHAVAFTGEVTALVPGWSAVEGREVTVVYLNVEEVFQDLAGALWPGKLVAFAQTYGDLEVEGFDLCTVPETIDSRLAVGDRLLVFGGQEAPDTVSLADAEMFPVIDGQILPQPMPGRVAEPARLAAFREQQLSRKTEQPERLDGDR